MEDMRKYHIHKHILCVDMKSFYASCAALLRGLDPLKTYLAVVADRNRRGSVVLAATPSLKRDYGIKTGSRLFEIPKQDNIIVTSAEMDMFLHISVEITRLFLKYVPKEAIHTYSVDESFLEVDGALNLWGSAEKIAYSILSELKDTFGMTAAVGIGPNMLMAKLCLDLEAKHKGVARWTYEDIPSKLWQVNPLSRMWGIGSRLERRLNNMGITRVGQLARYSLRELEKTFGVMGNQLYYHAHGIDYSELGAPILEGQETYEKGQILLRDYHDPQDVCYVILEMCEEVATRARTDHMVGRTIVLGIGYSKNDGGGGFRHRTTLDRPTNMTMEIYQACLYLFHRFYEQKTVRQISISLAKISKDVGTQLDLFNVHNIKEKHLGYVLDHIRHQYGQDSLFRAVSYTHAGTAIERSKLIGGHRAR